MLRICQPYLFTQCSTWRGVASFYNKAIINVTLEAVQFISVTKSRLVNTSFFLPHTSLLNFVIAQWGKCWKYGAEWSALSV